jgi:hypothetical protein
MPLRGADHTVPRARSTELLDALNLVANRYDRAATEPALADLLGLPGATVRPSIGALS